jgi:hypothetical protein
LDHREAASWGHGLLKHSLNAALLATAIQLQGVQVVKGVQLLWERDVLLLVLMPLGVSVLLLNRKNNSRILVL